MNAADERAEKPWWAKRWVSLAIGLAIVLAFVCVLATSHFGDGYLPPETFAGCYLSANSDPLELDASGAARSRGSAVGSFKVLAPVGGKHGPLIAIDGVSALTKGANVYFQRGRDGYFWPVSEETLQVTYPPDHSVAFHKASAAQCY